MDHELSELRVLRARVDMLERALTSGHPAPGRSGRGGAPSVCGFGALVALLATVVAVLFDLPITVRGAGPTTVTAPFVIKDASGHVLVTVDAGAGGGQLFVFGSNGVVKGQFGVDSESRGALNLAGGPSTAIVDATGMTLKEVRGKNVVRLEAAPDGTAAIRFSSPQGQPTAVLGSEKDAAGVLRIFGKGADKAQDWKVGLGVAGDHGVVTLNGLGQRALGLTGNGQIFGRTSAGKEGMSLGVDNLDQGYFSATNTSGAVAATMSIGGDGTGMLQVFRKGGEPGAVVGTRGGTNGDVCVNGPKSSEKGSVCLSVLAAKTFTPY